MDPKLDECKAEATDDEFVGFMVKDYRVCSMRFNLCGIRKEEGEEFVGPSIKEIAGDNVLSQVEVTKIFHSDGLLLCVLRDKTRLVVWNPYLGETKWIEPRNTFHSLDRYALGYTNRNHKILRFLDNDLGNNNILFGYEIFDISSNSWRVLDITPDFDTDYFQRGVSLKGNTYFFAKEKLVLEEGLAVPEPTSFLLCFDFTSERFGPSLPLPFSHDVLDTGSLSCVRDEKLAALCQGMDTTVAEIWVTTKIEPNAVSWIPFLKVDVDPNPAPDDFDFHFSYDGASFFIDEAKKTAVVFDIDGAVGRSHSTCHQAAYILGENGFLKKVGLGPLKDQSSMKLNEFNPLVCSYALGLARINQTNTT